MKYTKPQILAQSFLLMAECRPNSKPSGRPCNPPTPGGREQRRPINNNYEKGDESKKKKLKKL